MKSLDKTRRYIAGKVRQLRQERRWTQSALAEKLDLSQARLSEIERGEGSFSAEQFIKILGLFNVAVADFVPVALAATEADELQNVLARRGARHLLENLDLLPSERVRAATDVVRETLVLAKHPRLITGLAPVIVQHIDEINLHVVNAELARTGLERRLGWLVENVADAITRERAHAPRRLAANYRGAELILGNFLGLVTSELRHLPSDPKLGVDVLDSNIRSKRTLQDVIESSSPISKRWRIATSIQPDDFLTALRAANDVG